MNNIPTEMCEIEHISGSVYETKPIKVVGSRLAYQEKLEYDCVGGLQHLVVCSKPGMALGLYCNQGISTIYNFKG